MEYLKLELGNKDMIISYGKPSHNYIKNKDILKLGSNYEYKIGHNIKKTQTYKDLSHRFWIKAVTSHFRDISPKIHMELGKKGNKVYYKEINNQITVYEAERIEFIKKKGSKFEYIESTLLSNELFKALDIKIPIDKEKFYIDHSILRLSVLYDMLREGGTYLTVIDYWSLNQTIDLLYLHLALFREVILVGGKYLVCIDFNPHYISKIDLKGLIGKKYMMDPKPKLKQVIQHIQTYHARYHKISKCIFEMDYGKLDMIHTSFTPFFLKSIESTLNNKTILKNIELYREKIINPLKTSDSKSKKFYIETILKGMGAMEHAYIKKLILNDKMKNIVEIGMGFGISSVMILHYLDETHGKLVSIDPTQKSFWKNVGMDAIKLTGYDKFHTLINDNIINIYHKLRETGKETHKHNMCLITNWKYFTDAIVNVYFADHIIKVGGFIVISGGLNASLTQMLEEWIKKSNEYYVKVESPITLQVFKKLQHISYTF